MFEINSFSHSIKKGEMEEAIDEARRNKIVNQ